MGFTGWLVFTVMTLSMFLIISCVCVYKLSRSLKYYQIEYFKTKDALRNAVDDVEYTENEIMQKDNN